MGPESFDCHCPMMPHYSKPEGTNRSHGTFCIPLQTVESSFNGPYFDYSTITKIWRINRMLGLHAKFGWEEFYVPLIPQTLSANKRALQGHISRSVLLTEGEHSDPERIFSRYESCLFQYYRAESIWALSAEDSESKGPSSCGCSWRDCLYSNILLHEVGRGHWKHQWPARIIHVRISETALMSLSGQSPVLARSKQDSRAGSASRQHNRAISEGREKTERSEIINRHIRTLW
jgi:hypothetical protein